MFLESIPEQSSSSASLGYLQEASIHEVNQRIVPLVQDLIIQRKMPTMPCYVRAPHNSRNPSFVGRESVLNELDSALLPPDQVDEHFLLKSCTLHGLGGLGKTEVAVEFAHSREPSFDAIFWAQADEETKLAESFARFARALGLLEPTESADRKISRRRVLEWLADPIKRLTSNDFGSETGLAKWLLIFDNADDLALIQSYWPNPAIGSILVTSRDPLSRTDLTSNVGIAMPELLPEESAHLLESLVGDPQSPHRYQDALKLAKRFYGLPLAINQLAALIRRREMTISEFLATFGKEPSIADLAGAPAISQQERSRRTLMTVWRFESFSTEALNLLGLLSLLDPDRIGETVLQTNIPLDIVPDYPSDAKSYNAARAELTKSSTVERIKEKNHLRLHRLVQEVALDVIQEVNKSDISKHFQLAIELLFNAWPDQYDAQSLDNEAWEASDEIVSHVVKVQKVFAANRHWRIPIETTKKLVKLLQSAGW